MDYETIKNKIDLMDLKEMDVSNLTTKAIRIVYACDGKNEPLLPLSIIEEKMIPTTEQFRAYCEKFQEDSRHLSLHVGEDYVLLGTVPAESAARLQEALKTNDCQFHPIGKTVAESGLRLEGRDGSVEAIRAKGWNHFR